MAERHYWIQLENKAWDVAPHNIDRRTGRQFRVWPTSPGLRRLVELMNMPLGQDALILRRYTENWVAPDDRKVNPWDLNEPDPRWTGGTIPGPVIECDVGDTVKVHFRNWDARPDTPDRHLEHRVHSLHAHGFVFDAAHDGAYPLSPPDYAQPVGVEAAAWEEVGVSDRKRGDRVPPGNSFTYTWETLNWPTTAGVWLYHDHSIHEMESINLGAIGIIVIHNPGDPNDILEHYEGVWQDLPGAIYGPLTELHCTALIRPEPLPPVDLEPWTPPGRSLQAVPRLENGSPGGADPSQQRPEPTDQGPEPPSRIHKVRGSDLMLQVSADFRHVTGHCEERYIRPPKEALYLQLYHELTGRGMCINGRKYLGNTPTFLAGPDTKMRFGVVGMNLRDFHTFHLHGHRWVIPGPDGDTREKIETSPQVTSVSQFEDTKVFGPANSFSFTIQQGSFMGAVREEYYDPLTLQSAFLGLGEWLMHCHVLTHMDAGMIGSLLVVPQDGGLVLPLPKGEPLPGPPVVPTPPPGPRTVVVGVYDNFFLQDGMTMPGPVIINKGDTVKWVLRGGRSHTVTSDSLPPVFRHDFSDLASALEFPHTFMDAGVFSYHCETHYMEEVPMVGVVAVLP